MRYWTSLCRCVPRHQNARFARLGLMIVSSAAWSKLKEVPMKLQNVFREVAIKELVAVDLPELGSNQHEINGSSSLKEFFRTDEKIKEAISWHYFDDEGESSSDTGEFTFYDARLKSADRTGRSEWRGYYTGEFL